MGDAIWEAYLRLAIVLFTLAGAFLLAVVFVTVFDGYTLVNRWLR